MPDVSEFLIAKAVTKAVEDERTRILKALHPFHTPRINWSGEEWISWTNIQQSVRGE